MPIYLGCCIVVLDMTRQCDGGIDGQDCPDDAEAAYSVRVKRHDSIVAEVRHVCSRCRDARESDDEVEEVELRREL